MLMTAAVTELRRADPLRRRAAQPLALRWRRARRSPQNRPIMLLLFGCNRLIRPVFSVLHGTVRPTPPPFLPGGYQPGPTTAPSKNGRGFGGGFP